MRFLKYLGIAAILATAMLPETSLAASDGTIGTTSTGSAAISVTIPKLIRARSFSDFNMSSSYTGTGDLNANDDLNISTNYGTAARKYTVNASGSGASSAFTVTDGTDTIAYNAYFNDASGTSGRVALTAATDLTTQGGASKPLSDSTLNANLSIEMLQANLQAVDAGTYSGTITLVFTPE